MAADQQIAIIEAPVQISPTPVVYDSIVVPKGLGVESKDDYYDTLTFTPGGFDPLNNRLLADALERYADYLRNARLYHCTGGSVFYPDGKMTTHGPRAEARSSG